MLYTSNTHQLHTRQVTVRKEKEVCLLLRRHCYSVVLQEVKVLMEVVISHEGEQFLMWEEFGT